MCEIGRCHRQLLGTRTELDIEHGTNMLRLSFNCGLRMGDVNSCDARANSIILQIDSATLIRPTQQHFYSWAGETSHVYLGP